MMTEEEKIRKRELLIKLHGVAASLTPSWEIQNPPSLPCIGPKVINTDVRTDLLQADIHILHDKVEMLIGCMENRFRSIEQNVVNVLSAAQSNVYDLADILSKEIEDDDKAIEEDKKAVEECSTRLI